MNAGRGIAVLAACGLVLAIAVGEHRALAQNAASPAGSPGRRVAVPAGGDFQAALDRAQPGDIIVLEAGATYIGPFTIPRKTGDDWITIQSSAVEDNALPAGWRVDPAQSRHMPKLVAGMDAVLTIAPGAHHVRLIGLEIRPQEGVHLSNLVVLGMEARTLEELPHHISVDRCYLRGDPDRGARRGLALNARHATVQESYFSDFKDRRADSQAIAVWNSPGPLRITNNYLEGAGENIMIGGADPLVRDLVPADIDIRGNHLAKPLTWKPGEAGYTGASWTVKNLLELKNARRVRIESNLLENNWEGGQSGFAILFTVRNQDGRSPWSVVEDVTFAGNVVRHTAAGVNILGRDDIRPSQPTRRITIRDNLFEDVGGPRWGGRGILFQLLAGTSEVVIEHNTALQTGSIIMAEGAPHQGFVYRNNVSPHNALGIVGTGTATGSPTLQRYFPGAIVEGNVMAGGDASRYPRGNFFPSSLEGVGFKDRARGDYRLTEGSRYRRGAGDRDPGVDADGLRAARAAAERATAAR